MTNAGTYISFSAASFTPQGRSVTIGLAGLEPDQRAALEQCAAAGGRVDAGVATGVAVVKKSGDSITIEGLPQEAWYLVASSTFCGVRVLTEAGTTKAVLVDHPTSFSKFTPAGIQAFASSSFAKKLRAGLTAHANEGETSVITSELVKKAAEAVKKPKITTAQRSIIDSYVGVLHRDHPAMKAHEINQHAHGLAEAMGCEAGASLGPPYDLEYDDGIGAPGARVDPEKFARANFRNALAKVRANPQVIRAASMGADVSDRGIPESVTKSITALDPKNPNSLGKALAAVLQHPMRPGQHR